MAVKLRLMRMGKKKQPTYRDRRGRQPFAARRAVHRDRRHLRARMEPSVIEIDNDKAVGWLAKGAQPTETVRKLLVISGAWEQFESSRPAEAGVRPPRTPGPRAGPAKRPPPRRHRPAGREPSRLRRRLAGAATRRRGDAGDAAGRREAES